MFKWFSASREKKANFWKFNLIATCVFIKDYEDVIVMRLLHPALYTATATTVF